MASSLVTAMKQAVEERIPSRAYSAQIMRVEEDIKQRISELEDQKAVIESLIQNAKETLEHVQDSRMSLDEMTKRSLRLLPPDTLRATQP